MRAIPAPKDGPPQKDVLTNQSGSGPPSPKGCVNKNAVSFAPGSVKGPPSPKGSDNKSVPPGSRHPDWLVNTTRW